MSRIISYLGQDGLLHLLVSLVLCLFLSALMPLWASASITFLVGAAKELAWDGALGKGSVEWKDIVADIAGVLIGVLSVVLLDYVRPLMFALYGEV